MAVELFNNASCSAVVATALNSTDAAGTVDTVTVTTTGSWAVAASGVSQFRVCDKNDANGPDNPEIMVVTASANGSSVSWTLTRGAEGSTISAHAGGWTAVPVPTAGALENLQIPVGTIPPFVSGETLELLTGGTNKQFPVPAAGEGYFLGFAVGASQTITGLLTQIVTAGSTGALLRLGLYKDAGLVTPQPGALLVDGGTINAQYAGRSTLSVAATLTPGIYWMIVVPQGTYTTAPQAAVGYPNVPLIYAPYLNSITPANQWCSGFWYQSGLTGALPATATPTTPPNGGGPASSSVNQYYSFGLQG